MTKQKLDIGIVGLGVMGRNLVLNIADHGFGAAGYDKDKSKVDLLREEAEDRPVGAADNVADFIDLLKTPRAVMMLVPAGPPVDSVIHDLLPHLQAGDLVIDGGNSHFPDTDLRAKTLAEKGILYLGVGISGGEEGARRGPSIMPGGTTEGYARVRDILEAAAAKVDGEPCVTYLGPGSAGHYVKMVHNGIEYGLMQLIAETYDLMKRGLGLTDEELHSIYRLWNEAELAGYLMEITAAIFERSDERTGNRLIDMIEDEAKQKGTGMWTSQDAMNLGVPTPTIDAAVLMRNLSAREDERHSASHALAGPSMGLPGNHADFVDQLRNALFAAMILTYAQGMAQLHEASQEHDYGLDLEAVARIWRGGCIIRADLLEDIRAAFRRDPGLANLMLDPDLGQAVQQRQADLRAVVCTASEHGIPAPGLMSALGYYDGYRSDWLPANLIQAQRDYFGAHSYERVDAQGSFHTQWQSPQEPIDD
ncbi:MAG: NADP-dependent phosphogluconate dehydrogenase [Caldilineae bacterium]|nr:NADP-dependent phosphogluconate dehydrogenase [Caldilineae bacterium]